MEIKFIIDKVSKLNGLKQYNKRFWLQQYFYSYPFTIPFLIYLDFSWNPSLLTYFALLLILPLIFRQFNIRIAKREILNNDNYSEQSIIISYNVLTLTDSQRILKFELNKCKATETPNYIVIKTSNKKLILIPKQYFENSNEISTLLNEFSNTNFKNKFFIYLSSIAIIVACSYKLYYSYINSQITLANTEWKLISTYSNLDNKIYKKYKTLNLYFEDHLNFKIPQNNKRINIYYRFEPNKTLRFISISSGFIKGEIYDKDIILNNQYTLYQYQLKSDTLILINENYKLTYIKTSP
jgi:hypothetical protein